MITFALNSGLVVAPYGILRRPKATAIPFPHKYFPQKSEYTFAYLFACDFNSILKC